ncbi:Pentatricopeptide repeat-containing protein, chloroplastic [Vitis vinifera]|uniref:Pentatricopeptide repeat-containing protein, chloroplastic n=1 Tax=Vitis vinifera TaxID=29760 RepID=A0A438J6T0_VITVI|nr:Pentatricopeptide repeat-containing protein, chloroplastic [Vitis vinifera]
MPYCLLMDGLAKSRRILEAKSIFEEMKKKQVKSDGYCYSIMISAFCRGGLLKEAKQLARDFEATYDKYDLVMLNTMLCAYCRAGEMESVMQMMRKMDELAISPDWNTFHILIKYFCKEKLYLLAYRTMEDMHNKGHQPEEVMQLSIVYHVGDITMGLSAFQAMNLGSIWSGALLEPPSSPILPHLLIRNFMDCAYFRKFYPLILCVVMWIVGLLEGLEDFSTEELCSSLISHLELLSAQDNEGLISKPSIKKFATAFMKFGNVNLINDVMKAIHGSGYKIDQELFQMAVTRYIAEPEKKELLLHLLQWMPGQGLNNRSKSRIDRFLISEDREAHVQGAIQAVLARPVFDHSLILLDGGGMRRGPTPFRFENMWLKEDDFKEEIRQWWRGFKRVDQLALF